MRTVAWLVVMVLSACSDDAPEPEIDASTALDGGMDAALPDAGPPPEDAGPDGGEDAATAADAATGIECDEDRGIECDGDWDGRCTPGCAADECCAPVSTEFTCVPRDAEGGCPAADIWVDTSKIEGRYSIGWREFDAASCSIEEACVEAPGWRRLLSFDTWTPNTGTADLYLGAPEDSAELFEFSPCHDHFHFNSYARYELRDSTGAVAARGHKQSFCLLDFFSYPEEVDRDNYYGCENQGIQVGFQDVYGDHLDCQWVDVTDVPPGDYLLRIELNYEGILLESDYSNNIAEVTISIPPADMDVTDACPAGTARGVDRECGLTVETAHTCTAGEMLRVSCSDQCGLGSCTGDPFLRVCGPEAGLGCTGRFILGANDDADCGAGSCRGAGGACCPQVDVVCPASGEIVPYWGSYDPDETATCTIAVSPVP